MWQELRIIMRLISFNDRKMQNNIGIVILLGSALVTNAFVPIETQTKFTHGVAVTTRPTLLSLQGYSNNNGDDNSNSKDRLISSPEQPIDPTSSSSSSTSGLTEFSFDDDSVNLAGITPPSIGFNDDELKQYDILDNDTVQRQQQQATIISESVSKKAIDMMNESSINFIESKIDDNINEDLKAVLAASGKAAALAEASLSPELVEQLDELAINATTTILECTKNDDETIMKPPPEVIATITPPTTVVVDPNQPSKASMVGDFPDLVFTKDDTDIMPSAIIPTISDSVVAQDKNQNQVDDDTKDKKIQISTPSVGKILRFAIPAIGVWLCSPLLSLIDTSAVGVLCGTTQQAALNPAVAVTDYTALLIAFLYTGTTNMVASAQESDRGTNDKPRTAKMMIGAMQMSTYVGVGLGAVLFIFARPLLTAIIGNDAISPAVFAAAMKYVKIRALGMPAAAIIGSTQAACLGMQDIRTPLYVLAAAAVVNFFGDIFFVGQSNPLFGGAAGAAWATILSQYAAVTFFIRWLRSKPKRKSTIEEPPQIMNLSDAILEITSKAKVEDGKRRRQSLQNILENLKLKSHRRNKRTESKVSTQSDDKQQRRDNITGGKFLSKILRRRIKTDSKSLDAGNRTNNSGTKSSTDSFSAHGFLNNRLSPIDLFKFPDKQTRTEFSPYLIPVTTTQVGRVSGYVAMSHVVASSLGTVNMAAQQVIVSIFYCLCPIADSLSLTAQSFVPTISEKEPSREKAVALKKTLINFLKAGAVFGGAMMAAVSAIPLLSRFFTSDPAVISLVNSVVPLLLVFFGVHGFVCGTEGMLLGQKDLGYLGKMYAAFFAIVPYAMLKVKKRALAGTHAVGLTSVWSVFIGYQLCRCGLWLARSLILQRRTDTEANNMLTP